MNNNTINLLFPTIIDVDGLSINIDDFPTKKDIILKYKKYITDNPNEAQYFQENLNLVKPFINNKLNNDVIKIIEKFAFEITKENFRFIYKSIFENILMELFFLTLECNSDMAMFPPDTIEYQTAYLLSESLQNKKYTLTSNFNNIYNNL